MFFKPLAQQLTKIIMLMRASVFFGPRLFGTEIDGLESTSMSYFKFKEQFLRVSNNLKKRFVKRGF